MRKRFALLCVVVSFAFFLACQSAELTSARIYVQQNDYENALKQLKVAEQKEPTNPEVFIMLGKLYAEMDSFALMTKSFDRALELDSTGVKDIDAWRIDKRAKVFRKGQKAGERKKWEQAIEYSETAVLIDPSYVDGWYNLGYFYQKAGAEEKSKEAYFKAYQLEPDNLMLAKQAAVFKYNEGNTDEAIDILNKVLENGEPDIESYTLLGNLYVSKGEAAKAEKVLDKAEALDPNNANLLFDRGVAKYNQKDFDGAIIYFGKILEIDTNNRDALYNLSLSQFSAGNYKSAIVSAEKLVKNNPQDREGWEQFSMSLLRGEQVQKGKTANLVVESLDAMTEGDFDTAIKNLQSVTKKNKDWCAAWAVLKVACDEKGDSEGSTAAQAGLDSCGK
ncbi:tetratricopeptide repeat protein [bacterium]|nr:tetratricopeptide repeat protein [bacterium]